MNATAKLFWILTGFFVLASAGYTVWGLSDKQFGGKVEWVGTLALALVAILAGLIAFYVSRVYKAQGGELPEDSQDANIEDGEAEQGFFSPWSWWPIVLGGGAALMFTGLAVGNWICFIAVPVVAIGVIGLIFEYQRGYFGH
jgi:hypothetical protein